MSEKTENFILYEKAEKAIKELAKDLSVPIETTIESLEFLSDVCLDLLQGLEGSTFTPEK